MRKLLIFTLCFVLSVCFLANVVAEIDISGLSYEELVELVNKAQMEMMKSDKWQEVEVPAGTYLIGQDIPAGKWTISCNKQNTLDIRTGSKLKPNGLIDIFEDINDSLIIYLTGSEYFLYKEGDTSFVSVDLKEGQYIQISDSSAYFTPFKGNSFSFK